MQLTTPALDLISIIHLFIYSVPIAQFLVHNTEANTEAAVSVKWFWDKFDKYFTNSYTLNKISFPTVTTGFSGLALDDRFQVQ